MRTKMMGNKINTHKTITQILFDFIIEKMKNEFEHLDI